MATNIAHWSSGREDQSLDAQRGGDVTTGPDRPEEGRPWVPVTPHCLDQACPGPSLTPAFSVTSSLAGFPFLVAKKGMTRRGGPTIYSLRHHDHAGHRICPHFPPDTVFPQFHPSLCLICPSTGLTLSKATSLHLGSTCCAGFQ